jgi:DNA-binding transcriptional ArsR family regulator
MSPSARNNLARKRTNAPVFAALGDETRLSIIAKLANGQPCSIVQLTNRSKLTRQAITKHLRVLEGVGIVKSIRSGRESLFELDPKPIAEIRNYLDLVSEQWDLALSRLKLFVER